jgi:hypothetical protein
MHVTEDGFIDAVYLVMALTGRDRNNAAKLLREFQGSDKWTTHTWKRIEFKLEKQAGRAKKLVSLKQAIVIIQHLPCRADADIRYKMIGTIEKYIKDNNFKHLEEVIAIPPKKAEITKTPAKLIKSHICKIHNKSAYTCKGCVELFKQDPENQKCPRLICPKHFQQIHRCKGCNKTQTHAMCKLHGQRKVICPGCIKLHKSNPDLYPCPSGICKDHFKRKSVCHCRD